MRHNQVRKQPKLALGSISSGGIGSQDVNIGGTSNPFETVSSGSTRNEGENVLVLFVDDDTPVIIGDGGYSTP